MSDPYRNFKFEVEVEGFVRAGFSKVSGLDHTVESIEYREGCDNESPRQLPGQSKFGEITLERGMSTDSDFVTWIQKIYDLDKVGGAQGDDNFRKNPVVYLKNKAGTRVKKWAIKKAWPNKKGNPDLDASGNDVAIESLTLVHEGCKETTL